MDDPNRRRPSTATLAAGTLLAVVVVGAAATVAPQWLGDDPGDRPAPTVPTERVVMVPVPDAANMGALHATSRLQFDECQQDYNEISDDPYSSRQPLYFC